jgi:thymidylate kinase
MLRKIDSFFNYLNENNVKYCHWKSNTDLDRTLCGMSDIDLLVSRQDRKALASIIQQLGMVKAVAPLRKDMPGIEDYVGFDEESGKLFHLHLHYVLIFGEKYVKNHVWNIEEYLLDTATSINNVRVTDPNIELAMLFVRTFLKIDTVDILKHWLRINKYYFPSHIVSEYGHLLSISSEKELRNAHNTLIPYTTFDSFNSYIHDIEKLPLHTIITLRRQTFRYFKIYERYGWLRRVSRKLYLASRKNRLTRLWNKNIGKKHLAEGGISIAILGPDGSGKSTQLIRLRDWLTTNLSVSVFYLGSGDGKKGVLLSALDFANNALPKRKKTGKSHTENQRILSIYKPRDIFFMVRALLIARHRLDNILRAHKAKSRGDIVLYDRFPQIGTYGISDGPKIVDSDNPLISRLHNIELRLYQKMMKLGPDKYIVLAIDPHECLRRKPDHDLDNIREKMELLNNFCEQSPTTCERIDAQQDIDAVTLSIERTVWQQL